MYGDLIGHGVKVFYCCLVPRPLYLAAVDRFRVRYSEADSVASPCRWPRIRHRNSSRGL